MKTLLFILLIVFASCEKDKTQDPQIPRTCWRCDYRYLVAIPQQTRTFCDGTDIGLANGDITEAQIRQFEQAHYIKDVLVVECKSFKEK